MARYRKVEVATWLDERFRSLSPAAPCGQHLWLFLLSGPHTTSLPGLLVGREEAMAAELGWSLKAFREAFGEVSGKGMAKADWKAGLVVLRKALFDSSGEPRATARPESPNVIRGWGKYWDEIPDCDLKIEYLYSLKAFAEALGEAFHKAFQEGFRKALLKASSHPSPNQDQDQDQDQNIPPISPPQGDPPDPVSVRGRRKRDALEPTETELASVRVVLEKLGAHNGVRYTGAQAHVQLIVRQLRAGVSEMDLRAIVAYCALEKGWRDDPKMREYLRPETLFGPQTIARYLDPARAWAESLPDRPSHQTREKGAA